MFLSTCGNIVIVINRYVVIAELFVGYLDDTISIRLLFLVRDNISIDDFTLFIIV